MHKSLKRMLSSVLAVAMVAGSMAAACVSAGATTVEAANGFLISDCNSLEGWKSSGDLEVWQNTIDTYEQDMYLTYHPFNSMDFTGVWAF